MASVVKCDVSSDERAVSRSFTMIYSVRGGGREEEEGRASLALPPSKKREERSA